MQLIFHQFLGYSMVYCHQFINFAIFPPDLQQSTAVAQLVETLRYKPKGRGCSIPDGVSGVFHCLNPSGSAMVLGSTQPLTEMSTRNIS